MKILITAIFSMLIASPAFAQVNNNSASLSQSQSGAQVVMNSTAIQQAPGVGAPGLAAAGIETCTSSASSGFSGPGFGFSFGATDVDDGCDARLDARTLASLGQNNAALFRLCERQKIAIALAQAGTPCPPNYYTETQRKAIWSVIPQTVTPPNVTTRQADAVAAVVIQNDAANAQVPTVKRRYNADTNTWE